MFEGGISTSFGKKWGWYDTIAHLSSNNGIPDLVKMQDYYRLNIVDFLNHLSYLKDKEYFEKYKTLENDTNGD